MLRKIITIILLGCVMAGCVNNKPKYTMECIKKCRGLDESKISNNYQKINKKVKNELILYEVQLNKVPDYDAEKLLDYDPKTVQYTSETSVYLINGSLSSNLQANYFDVISEIITKAESETAYHLAVSTLDWIWLNIDHAETNFSKDVNRCLADKEGGSLSKTNLFNTVMKSFNIPSRILLGINYSNNSYTSWSEIYVENQGWIPIDVSNRQFKIPSDVIMINYGNDFNDDINFLDGSKLEVRKPEIKNE